MFPSAEAALIFLLKKGGPVVAKTMLKFFAEARRPKCYASCQWEDYGTPNAPRVIKLAFDIINVSDDPIEILDFTVSHPSGTKIVEDHAELLNLIYKRGEVPALTDRHAINEELDGQKYTARSPAERSHEGRREYTFYLVPIDEHDPVFSMTKTNVFSENVAALVMRYRHADEMGRVRKMTVAAVVPAMKKVAA